MSESFTYCKKLPFNISPSSKFRAEYFKAAVLKTLME